MPVLHNEAKIGRNVLSSAAALEEAELLCTYCCLRYRYRVRLFGLEHRCHVFALVAEVSQAVSSIAN
jgi:hypothetical protein